MENYLVDENGYYGEFGGAYIPEILHKCVSELQNVYLDIIESEEFQKEFHQLLTDYAGRPSPLYYAKRMSDKYHCKLYLKREDLNHTGAHKINNAIGQILVARKMGKKRIIAETGAGQHGVATATVCALMNMECVVYMGKTDIERQHVNVERMKMLGAKVQPVTSGNMTLKDATNEAIRDWCCHPEDTYYLIGSTVGPHPYPDMVARLQSVISAEIKQQLMDKEGRDYPDMLIACVGGGSNAAGTVYHYINDERVKIVLAEAGGLGVESGKTAATIKLGKTGIIHGSRTYVIQNEDGQIEEPYSISAGLDYPGIGPIHANMSQQHRATVLAINDDEAIRAGYELTRMEGIIPALESAHALGALPKLNFKEDDVVVLTVSGRGDKDIDTYLKYNNNGTLIDNNQKQ
jgi:tryptophan synthase beta chain